MIPTWLRAFIASAVVAVLMLDVSASAAHSPDPILGGALFAQNQDVRYRWRAGEAPPAAMQTAIKAAAADANRSRLSRAATFTADAAGASWINYGLNVACGVNGLACFNRVNAPNSFSMSFREQGHVFDWGVLQWCQMTVNQPDGCFDAENIALDEFGHVEILNHHLNFSDDHDYLDAVVQTFSHARPQVGWNAQALARCDVATLQRKYDLPLMTSAYSTCLDLATSAGIATSSTLIAYNSSVTLTATLGVVDLAEYERLGGNPVSGRTVLLQRRGIGGVWTNYATMPAGASAGTYVYTATTQKATADWRAVFSKPAGEGLRGAVSAIVRVTVAPCQTGCPASAVGSGQ
ncbi:MAG: hypothetical protein M3067_09370 [Chloroflexota bacterium]|nr:hypothetical protein [Chloroflexota bacterium]